MPNLTYQEAARRACLTLEALGCPTKNPVQATWMEVDMAYRGMRSVDILVIEPAALEWLMIAADIGVGSGAGLAPTLKQAEA